MRGGYALVNVATYYNDGNKTYTSDPHRHALEQQLMQKEGAQELLRKKHEEISMKAKLHAREVEKLEDIVRIAEEVLHAQESKFSGNQKDYQKNTDETKKYKIELEKKADETKKIQTEIEEIHRKFEEKKRELEKLYEAIKDLERKIHEGTRSFDSGYHEISVEQDYIVRAREKVSHARLEVARKQKDGDALEHNMVQVENEMARLEKEIKKMQQELGQ